MANHHTYLFFYVKRVGRRLPGLRPTRSYTRTVLYVQATDKTKQIKKSMQTALLVLLLVQQLQSVPAETSDNLWILRTSIFPGFDAHSDLDCYPRLLLDCS